MGLDGMRAYAELIGDITVGCTRGYMGENFPFPFCKNFVLICMVLAEMFL